jgi:hypothetical protein
VIGGCLLPETFEGEVVTVQLLTSNECLYKVKVGEISKLARETFVEKDGLAHVWDFEIKEVL